jgi:leader peptidase (prepilin peptidase)/N-methyltransferase
MVIDIEHRIIPYSLIIVGIILGFITGTTRVGIGAAIFGGIIGLLIMLFIYAIGIVFIKLSNRFRSSQLNEPALGFGDVLLGGVLGLMIGWPEIFNGLIISILIAGAFSLLLLIIMLVTRKYEFGTAFPYAPFLIIGAAYILFF